VVLSTPQVSASKAMPSVGTSQLKCPLSAYLPQSVNGALLVTTRTRSVAIKLVEPRDVIPVEPMAKVDAVVLFKKKVDVVNCDSDLEELASMLEYMPLAIVQAAAYIQQKGSRYSVRQYIEEFQRSDKRKTSLLNYEAGHLRRDQDAKNSIIITWQISFNYIREHWPSSADLLALMSFFDRQGIPKEVLTVRTLEKGTGNSNANSYCDKYKDEDTERDSASEGSSDDDSDQFEEDIDRLQNYLFVSAGPDEQTFEMHGLVQLATRKWLAMQEEDEQWRGEFCHKLNIVFPTGEHKNWSRCERLFPHVKAAERQRPAHDARVREWGRILRNAGWYCLAKGNYIEAERVCDKSTRVLRRLFGEDDVDTLSSMAHLASTFWNQGRWQEAETLEVQVMETRRRVLGSEHPDTLTSMANLASIYWNQGRWQEAETLFVQVMETRQRVLGSEHPHTLTSMANLASTFWNQGRWQEAETLEVQVMETRRRVLGSEHPDTLTSMANLASTYQNQGRWQEAETLFVQVMETRRRVLGPEHPDTLTSMANLASTFWNQGRWQEAETLFVQVMETRRRVLGSEHPSTLTSMANLAFSMKEQGRNIEAVKLMSECVRLRNRVLGAEHPHTLSSSAALDEWQSTE
jgi:tetratricopeptide (TPR) repeat protein